MVDEIRQFDSGAVRSKDADSLDFTSLPLIGLIGVARTAAEGAAKYGRWNYLLGMPAHECVNHVIRHLVLWLAGDRSESHLSHAAWGCMAAAQSMILHPEINTPHLLGPGMTMTKEAQEYLDAGKTERAAKRANGDFDVAWSLNQLPEIIKLLEQRRVAQ